MRRALVILLAISTLAGSACDDPVGPRPALITELPRSLTLAERDVIRGSNSFAFGLLDAVRTGMPDSPNTFLSPLSASMALGMTMNGADGQTWSQMAATLGFAGMDEEAINGAYRSLISLLLELDAAVEFGLGNAIWVDDQVQLLPGFVDRTETHFNAEVDNLDFDDPASADVMNAWVDNVTNGRIRQLVEQVDPDAILYLINAIYFKADWRNAFDEDDTFDGQFTLADGRRVTVPMMSGHVGYRTLNPGSTQAVQGVELPYGGGAYGAVALLPPAGQSMNEFVAGIDDVTWAGWMEAFDAAAEEDTGGQGLQVQLPRFELEWGAKLNSMLIDMGMRDAFDEYAADFSRITGLTGPWISEVAQKTFVKVDEEGTEAAAATSVTVVVTSAPPTLTFDRPFLFAIRERLSGTILFLGVIGDPRS